MEDYKMKKKILIEGMSCGECIQQVKEALGKLIGVDRVGINLEENYVILDVNTEVRDNAIEFVIKKLGYKVIGIQAL